MFLLLCFVYMVIIETQNRRSNNIQKTSRKVTKLRSKFYFFQGLAKSGSEKPGPGTTLLGWPKSIYYIQIEPKRPPTDLAEAWESAPAESFFWHAINLAKRWYPPNTNNFNDFLFTWKKKKQTNNKKANRQTKSTTTNQKKKQKKRKKIPLRGFSLRRYVVTRYAVMRFTNNRQALYIISSCCCHHTWSILSGTLQCMLVIQYFSRLNYIETFQ